MLLVWKVAGIPHACDLVVMVIIGWFITSLYDSDSEELCSSLTRMRIKSLNSWSLLLCSGISPSLVLTSSTHSLPLIPARNYTVCSWSCSLSDRSFCCLDPKQQLHTLDKRSRESCRQVVWHWSGTVAERCQNSKLPLPV